MANKKLTEAYNRANSIFKEKTKHHALKLHHYGGYYHVEVSEIGSEHLAIAHLTAGTPKDIENFFDGIYYSLIYID